MLIQVKDEQKSSQKVFNFVQDLFMDNYQLANNSAELLNSLIKGRGLKYVVKIGTKILNKPVVLIDSSFKVLAHSENHPVVDPLWNDYIAKGYCSNELIHALKQNKTLQKLNQNNIPQAVTCEASTGVKMVKNIKIKDKVVGYVIVFGHDEASFSQADSKMISQLSSVLAEEMKKKDYYRNTSGLLYENLLLDLLDDNIAADNNLAARVHNSQCSFGENMYLVAIYLGQNLSDHYCIDVFREQLRSLFINCKIIYYQEYLLVLFDLDKDNFDEKISAKLNNFLNEHEFCAAVSPKFNDIMEFRAQFHKVKRALEFVTMVSIKSSSLFDKSIISKNLIDQFSNSRLFLYEDYKPYDLLNLAPQDELINYCNKKVIYLQNYDKEYNTPYLQCLREYLNTNQNINTAAANLYIHRNTMRNRINKVTELTDLDLECSQTVFHLQMSFLILDFLEVVN